MYMKLIRTRIDIVVYKFTLIIWLMKKNLIH